MEGGRGERGVSDVADVPIEIYIVSKYPGYGILYKSVNIRGNIYILACMHACIYILYIYIYIYIYNMYIYIYHLQYIYTYYIYHLQ